MRTQDRTQTCDFANRAGALAAGLGGGSPRLAAASARLDDGRGRHLRRGRRQDGIGLRSVRRLGAAVWRADVRGPARVLRAAPPPPPPPGSQGAAMQQLLAQQQQQQQQAAAAAQAAVQVQAAQAGQQLACSSAPPPPASRR